MTQEKTLTISLTASERTLLVVALMELLPEKLPHQEKDTASLMHKLKIPVA